MTIKIKLDSKIGPKLQARMKNRSQGVKDALAQTAQVAAQSIEEEGRADIASAGNFGSRWTEGFHAKVTAGGGNTVITVTEDVPYWRVFEFGAVIEGKPLLWIPLPFADDAIGVRARDYPGPLFRVDRKGGGAPLLLTTGGKPKYFGKESVTIPQKFHLRDIVREVARSMGDIYRSIRSSQKG